MIPFLCTIMAFIRRHPDGLAEHRGKIGKIVESHLLRHIADPDIRPSEQFLRGTNAVITQIPCIAM